jgi:hypothetical protein
MYSAPADNYSVEERVAIIYFYCYEKMSLPTPQLNLAFDKKTTATTSNINTLSSNPVIDVNLFGNETPQILSPNPQTPTISRRSISQSLA